MTPAEQREQLDWERRAGRPAAAAAIGAAVLLIGGTIVRQAVALESRPDPDLQREFLTAVNDESGAFVVSAVIQAVSFLCLGVVLWYLYRVTKYRRPELPGFAIALVYIGPVLLAVAGVVSDLTRIDVAEDFVSSGVTEGRRGEERAEDLLEERGSLAGAALGSGGTLALALSLVLINLNAMRAGLLSRFIGIIGIIVGALYVLPVFTGPVIVQLFWLGALAALFLGRWPGGRGPAWETGESVPWPSAGELRGRFEPEPQPDPPEPEEASRPASRKRKRKRRS